MRTTVRRVAGKVAAAVHEMNEAQRLAFVLRTATDHYVEHPDTAPATYAEFLARTAGALRHEPSARRRARTAG